MARILLINRNDFTAKDGATRSLKQLSESLPNFGYSVMILSLNVRIRELFILYAKMTIAVLKSDFVIINSLASGLEKSIRWLVLITKILRKKTFLYVRENHIHYTEIYEHKITEQQKESLITMCTAKHIRLWFVSKYAQRAFETHIQKKDDLARVVYNGVELDANNLTTKKNGKLVISAIGSLQELKGYNYFLSVAALFNKESSSIEFRWYGTGSDKHSFEKFVRENGMEDFCKLIEYTPLTQILSQSDAIMVCSKAESFSRVAIEALLAGKKLFVRSCLEATLEITEGECMILNENPLSINTEAFMKYLIEKQDMQKVLKVTEKYSMPNHCKRIIEALEA